MQVSLLDRQWEAMEKLEQYKYLLVCSGVGGGKTFLGSHVALNMAQRYPKAKGFISAATYRQLHNSTLSALFEELNRIGINFNYNKSSGILSLCGAQIYCYSLDNPEPIRGIEIGWAWLDEIALSDENSFLVLSGRLRDKNGPLKMILTTTPKGLNWLYDFFVGEKKTKDFGMVKGSSYDNHHLPSSYLETLSGQYDDKMRKQELEAEWVNLTSGVVYYAFDMATNVSTVKFDPSGGTIYCGMDFNVNPMTAVLFQIKNDVIHVFEELYLNNSNTTAMARDLLNRGWHNAIIYPDATGKALKTSAAGLSDHIILKQHGFAVAKVSNPYRVDRFNCVNGLLEKQRIKIDNSCKMLIRDFSRLTHDNKDESLSHISDALGYGCWGLFPLIQRRQTRVTQF